jgi:uncharacterized membrane protein YhaH (DUF805 family)
LAWIWKKANSAPTSMVAKLLTALASLEELVLAYATTIRRLSDTGFEQGMAGLRAHGANINPAEAVTEEIDWFVFTKRA